MLNNIPEQANVFRDFFCKTLNDRLVLFNALEINIWNSND